MIAQQWIPYSYKPIYSLDFSLDSRHLVSAGQDRKAVIWDISQRPRKVAILEGHADAIRTCAWFPNGNTIATGSEDGTARLWDAHTFRQLANHSFYGHVCGLAFSPNGCWIACGSRDGESSILDASGKLHQSLWSFTPDWIDNDISSAYTVDIESRESVCPFKLRGETRFGGIHSISFSPNGSRMLRVPATARREIHVWDASRTSSCSGCKGTRASFKTRISLHTGSTSRRPPGIERFGSPQRVRRRSRLLGRLRLVTEHQPSTQERQLPEWSGEFQKRGDGQ